MPTTYNGVGTWYYGKSKVETRRGICQQCGSEADLKSYDTRLFVVLLMIPVFSLGRKRVMDECSVCKRHRVMAADEWTRARERVAEVSRAYERKPDDAELAREVLGGIAGFADRERLALIGPVIERSFSTDAKLLAMLSSVHDHLGDLAQSERVCRLALAVHDDNDLREMLGDCLLKQGKTDDAAPMFAHIHTQGVPDRVNHLYRLAMAYQGEGRHEQALTAFEQCETVCPPIASDPTFKALRRASLTNLSKHTPVNANAVAIKAKSARQMGVFLRWAPVAVVVALLAYMGVSWFLASRCEIHLVNGLNRTYGVRIAGVDHQLQPRSRRTLRLAEGEVEVEWLDAPPGVDKEIAVIRRPFWSRPVANHTFVLNPDHAALLVHVRSFYVPAKAGPAPEPQTSLHGGRLLHEFRGIDYPFVPFPQQISMKSSERQVVKEGLDLPNIHDQAMVMTMMGLARGPQKGMAAEIARRRLLLEPDQSAMEWLMVLNSAASPEETVAFLKPRMGDRPLRMPWHRAYQTFAGKAQGEDSLEREYQAQLDADPQNRDLMYLVGRITKDPKRARELCDLAASGDKPCAYALYWQNGQHFAVGDLDAAARQAPRVIELLASEPEIVWRSQQILAAAKRLEPALEALRTLQKSKSSFVLPALEEEHYLLSMNNRNAEAQAALTKLKNEITPLMGPEHVAAYLKRVDAVVAYAQGRPGGLIQYFNQSEGAKEQACGKLMANDLEGASAKALEAKDDGSLFEHALIAMTSLARQPQAPQAKPHLKHLIDKLSKGARDDKIIASALAAGAEGPLDLAQLLECFEEPREKAVYLTIVGLQRPVGSVERGRCLELARRLNFDRRFPWLTVTAVLDGADRVSGTPPKVKPAASKPDQHAPRGTGARATPIVENAKRV